MLHHTSIVIFDVLQDVDVVLRGCEMDGAFSFGVSVLESSRVCQIQPLELNQVSAIGGLWTKTGCQEAKRTTNDSDVSYAENETGLEVVTGPSFPEEKSDVELVQDSE